MRYDCDPALAYGDLIRSTCKSFSLMPQDVDSFEDNTSICESCHHDNILHDPAISNSTTFSYIRSLKKLALTPNQSCGAIEPTCTPNPRYIKLPTNNLQLHILPTVLRAPPQQEIQILLLHRKWLLRLLPRRRAPRSHVRRRIRRRR